MSRQPLQETSEDKSKEIAYQPVSTEDDDDDDDDDGLGAERKRQQAKSWGMLMVESTGFQNVMAVVIVANGAVIGLETDCTQFEHWDVVEYVFLVIFSAEVFFKLIVERLLFFDPNYPDFLWNQFDGLIVGLGIFDAISSLLGSSGSGGFATIFRMVRLMRILRIFRLLKFLKRLYLLAVGLIEACKAVLWVTVLMSFLLYVCGIVLVRTVGRPPETDPDYAFMSEHFGTIIQSMITCFVLMSSPNLPVYQEEDGLLAAHPILTMFLIIFITFGSFGIIGMLSGVINQSMFENNEMAKEEKRLAHDIMRKSLGSHAAGLYQRLPLDSRGFAKTSDMHRIGGHISQLLDQTGCNIAHGDVLKFLVLMDEDETGFIDLKQFAHAMERIAEGVGPLALLEVQHHVCLCSKKLSKNIARVQAVEMKIESQMKHTSDEVGRILLQTEKILAAVLGSGADALCVSPIESHKTDVQSRDTWLEDIRTCESRVLTSVAKQFDNIDSTVRTTANKQLEQTERILAAVLGSEADALCVSPMESHKTDVQSRDTWLEDIRTCETRVLTSVAKQFDDIDSTVRTTANKQLEAFELVLPNIASKQLESVLNSLDLLMAREAANRLVCSNIDESLPNLIKRVDDIADFWEREEAEFSQQGDAAGGVKSHTPSSNPMVVFKTHVDSLEGKMLSGIAELGGVILHGLADLLCQNQATLKKEWTLQRELSFPLTAGLATSPLPAADEGIRCPPKPEQ